MVTATATPLTMAATRAVSQLSGLSHYETKKKNTDWLLQLFSMVSHFSRTWEPDTQSLAEEKVAS